MSKSGFLSGFFWGAVVGGVAALLYAPKSGRELREDLSEEWEKYNESPEEYHAMLAERAAEYRDAAVERGVELVDVASSKTEEIKVNLSQSAQQLKEQLDEFTHSLQQKAEATSDVEEEDADVVITEFKEALEQQNETAE